MKLIRFPSETIKIKPMWEWYTLIVLLVIILVAISSIIAALKNKYDLSARLISKCRCAWDKGYNLVSLFSQDFYLHVAQHSAT